MVGPLDLPPTRGLSSRDKPLYLQSPAVSDGGPATLLLACLDMSDTSLAAVERLRRDFPGVETVTRLVRSLARKGEEDQAVRFTEIFLTKAPRTFLAERPADAQARLALGTFHFLHGWAGTGPQGPGLQSRGGGG